MINLPTPFLKWNKLLSAHTFAILKNLEWWREKNVASKTKGWRIAWLNFSFLNGATIIVPYTEKKKIMFEWGNERNWMQQDSTMMNEIHEWFFLFSRNFLFYIINDSTFCQFSWTCFFFMRLHFHSKRKQHKKEGNN